MADANANARLEALSDGVFAIALTLLVIEVRPPATHTIGSTADLWRTLAHMTPQICAFLLSFTVIFITWVNHHAMIRSIPRTSPSFIYANGLMLLTVAFIPFPTALLGEFVLTDRAAPAVLLYNVVLACQAVSWIVVCGAALTHRLARDEQASASLRRNRTNGFMALLLYSTLAVAALWLPLAVAVVTTATWIVWLVAGVRATHA